MTSKAQRRNDGLGGPDHIELLRAKRGDRQGINQRLICCSPRRRCQGSDKIVDGACDLCAIDNMDLDDISRKTAGGLSRE